MKKSFAAKVRRVLALQYLGGYVRRLGQAARHEALVLAGWKRVDIQWRYRRLGHTEAFYKHPDHPRRAPKTIPELRNCWRPASAWELCLREFKAANKVETCMTCSLGALGVASQVPHSDRCEVAKGCLEKDARLRRGA